MNATSRRLVAVAAATALAAPLLLSASSASAHNRPDPARDATKLARKLVKEASGKDAYKHLKKFQDIADSAGGHRAAGSLGHDASAAYVYSLLKKAGYDVSYDTFVFTNIETQAETLKVVSPAPRDSAITAMSYTKSTPKGGITAQLAVVPVDATTGCEATDYAAGAFTGKIALIQRGGCDFALKQQTAAAAGAVAAIVSNNVAGALAGTLGDPAAARIPTGGITQAEGARLAQDAAAGPVTVNLDLRQLQEQRTTRNVIAETKGGNPANTVMLGSHLDSVTEGPGINDNASGSAGLLEVALDLAKSREKPANKVRFAWWSAEELGLLGAEDYVQGLTPEQAERIKLYLNFDMIASPNFGLFVYDGDDSDAVGSGPGPEGSAQLEKGITDFLDSQGHPHEGTDFSGRSDYGPFIAVGIPSGGTFTGAEGVKTAAQAAKFGGEAGVAYDPCYHAACDDLDNIDKKAFDVNVDVIADAVGHYAHDLSPLGAAAGTNAIAKTERTTGGDTGVGASNAHEHESRA
ncbi:M28 family metallopeptidase [Streptomyces sp. NBC_01498]|uniref:M28 family metallopeptidase n=1 Tax=Streptomyces sp. NBC_01498 TaxID=2975870 RepID=UPI002E7BD3F4|nr:M28 family metallopeptidase [Streptomyces sp. NBC_01498]WTL25993.1 M28 family metallopeptidase [Streptomyces sp. NBC_01498]